MFDAAVLKGKRILVTGGGTGLGKEMSVGFAAHGAHVYICGRRKEVLDQAVRDIAERSGGTVSALLANVRDPDSIEAMMSSIWAEGPLTGLVNNAAANFLAPTESLSPRGYEAVRSTVMDGSFYASLACGKRWIAAGLPGSIISNLVTWVWTGSAYVVPSAMAKAAVHAMTWGAEDLSAALGALTNKEADGNWTFPYQVARAQCLFAAGAAGVAALDTLYADFRDQDGLAESCRLARRDGFVGRVAIHPAQVATINTCFTPSDADLAHGRASRRARSACLRSFLPIEPRSAQARDGWEAGRGCDRRACLGRRLRICPCGASQGHRRSSAGDVRPAGITCRIAAGRRWNSAFASPDRDRGGAARVARWRADRRTGGDRGGTCAGIGSARRRSRRGRALGAVATAVRAALGSAELA